MILDLDDQKSWSPDFFSLFNPNVDICDDFLDQLTCSSDCLRNETAKEFRKDGWRIFSEQYEYVVGYHACCIKDLSTYQTEGIRVSNPITTTEIAGKIFAGIDGLDSVLENVEHHCPQIHRAKGTVGFLYSGNRAIKDQIHYLRGSEVLHCIAARLGEDALKRLQPHGHATLIKCRIPTKWLEIFMLRAAPESYVNELLAMIAKELKQPAEPILPTDGGYLIKQPIPRNQIDDFLDGDTGLPIHY